MANILDTLLVELKLDAATFDRDLKERMDAIARAAAGGPQGSPPPPTGAPPPPAPPQPYGPPAPPPPGSPPGTPPTPPAPPPGTPPLPPGGGGPGDPDSLRDRIAGATLGLVELMTVTEALKMTFSEAVRQLNEDTDTLRAAQSTNVDSSQFMALSDLLKQSGGGAGDLASFTGMTSRMARDLERHPDRLPANAPYLARVGVPMTRETFSDPNQIVDIIAAGMQRIADRHGGDRTSEGYRREINTYKGDVNEAFGGAVTPALMNTIENFGASIRERTDELEKQNATGSEEVANNAQARGQLSNAWSNFLREITEGTGVLYLFDQSIKGIAWALNVAADLIGILFSPVKAGGNLLKAGFKMLTGQETEQEKEYDRRSIINNTNQAINSANSLAYHLTGGAINTGGAVRSTDRGPDGVRDTLTGVQDPTARDNPILQSMSQDRRRMSSAFGGDVFDNRSTAGGDTTSNIMRSNQYSPVSTSTTHTNEYNVEQNLTFVGETDPNAIAGAVGDSTRNALQDADTLNVAVRAGRSIR